MGEVFRRVVLKPPGLSDSDSAALAERLAADVRLQQDLTSGSPHVLRLVGDLQETENSFVVEHEPAEPFGEALFDPDAMFPLESGPDEFAAFVERLLDWAVALLDALRGAHDRPGDRPVVHGGLCRGTLLLTPDRCGKVSDFGFAASICAVLGVEAYLNLAVGPRVDGPPDQLGTGIWEVLTPTKERDDRICGFIDVDKYINQTHGTFEAGSDIIAVGYVLHLMDLHRHPYLGDPRDHLLAETAESMAFNLYDGARRKTLRGSDDPRVKVWCDMVAQMLSNLPRERPAAAKVLAEFAKVGAKPFSREKAQKAELAEIVSLLRSSKWTEVVQRAQAVAADPASAETATAATAYRDIAQINVSLEEATTLLGSGDLPSARQLLDGLPDWPGLEGLADLSHMRSLAEAKRENVHTVLQVNDAAQEKLDRIEAAAQALEIAELNTVEDTKKAQAEAQALLGRLNELPEAEMLTETLRQRRETLQQALGKTQAKVAGLLADVEADEAAARDWLSRLLEARDMGDPGGIQDVLGDRPSVKYWPPDVVAEVKVIESQLEELRAAIKWLESFRLAIQAIESDEGELETSQKILREKPSVSHWPRDLSQEVDELTKRLTEIERTIAAKALAYRWIAEVENAVAREDWDEAQRILDGEKPSLANLPPDVLEDVLEQEKGLRKTIAKNVEKKVQIGRWLKSAGEAAQTGDYYRALHILDNPPVPLADLPSEIQEEAEDRKKDYAAKLREALAGAIQKMVLASLGKLLAKDLEGYLRPEAVQGKVDSIEWDSPERLEKGTAQFNVRLHGVEGTPGTPVVGTPFEFETVSGSPGFKDEKDFQDNLGAGLQGLVQRLQQHEAANLSTPLRDGLFPKGKVEVDLAELTTRTRAAVYFLGPKDSNATMETEIVWDPASLAWNYADPGELVQRAVDTAIKDVPKRIEAKLLEGSELDREYRSMVYAEVDRPDLAGKTAIPASLTLTGRLAMKVGSKGDQKLLGDFPVVCQQVGGVTVQAEPGEAEAAVQQIFVREQESSRVTIENDLRERLKNADIKKAKLAVSTRGLKKGPLETVEFLLSPKGGDKLTLEARWNRSEFELELTQEAQKDFQNLLDNPPVPTTMVPKWAKYVAVPGAVVVLGFVGAYATGMFSEPSVPPSRLDDGGSGPAAITIKTQPTDTSVCEGDDAEFSVEASGPINSYQWHKGDEILAAESAKLARLVLPEVQMGQGGSYRVDVMGPSGEVSSTPAELTVLPNVAITDHPTGGNRIVGEEVTFTVSATGRDLTYQWRKDDADIPGQTRKSLSLSRVTLADDGAYVVVVQSSCGGVSSNKALLMVAERRISSARVVQEIRGHFSASEWLGPLAAEMVDDEADPAATPPSVAYRIPGLADSERLALLAGPSANDEWELADGEAARIRQEIDELGGLLDGPHLAGDLAELVRAIVRNDFARYLLPDMLTTDGIEGPWTLAEDFNGWVGTGTAPVNVSGRDEQFTLTNIPMTAREGQVTPSFDDAMDAQIDAELRSILLGIQAEALGNWLGTVEDFNWPKETEVVPPTADGTELRDEVVWTVKTPGLVDWNLSARWDPEQLQFESAVELFVSLATYRSRVDIVSALNSGQGALKAIADVLPGATWGEEKIDPEYKTVTLTTDLPWKGTPAETEPVPGTVSRIEIRLPVGLLDEALAGWEAPPYWALLESYAAIEAHPDILATEEGNPWNTETLPEVWKDPAFAGLRFIAPQLKIVDGLQELRGGPTPTLRLGLEVDWAVREPPSDLDEEALNRALRELMETYLSDDRLELVAAEGQALKWVWSDAGRSPGEYEEVLVSLEHFDRLLATFDRRNRVEQELDGYFDSASTPSAIPLAKDKAAELLQQIWSAKLDTSDSTTGFPASFDLLMSNLAGKRRFFRGKNQIMPTMYIEYFSGPRFTYAIAWSGADSEAQEGPSLVRVCSNKMFAREDDLGKALFDPVFEQVGLAYAADSQPFDNRLGMVIAPDERLSLIEAGLDAIQFTPVTSSLSLNTVEGIGTTRSVQWDSLASLQNEDDVDGAYRLADSLARPATRWTHANVRGKEAKRLATAAFESAAENSTTSR